MEQKQKTWVKIMKIVVQAIIAALTALGTTQTVDAINRCNLFN